MKKFLLKSLLVTVGLLTGGSAWATDLPSTIGATGSNWETSGSYSDSYTLAAGKTLTFTFTVNESGAASESEDWKGYLAVIQESSTRHTLNSNTYTFVRSMCDYNVKGSWGSGAIYNTNTYPSGAKYTHFVGADVTMTIKRINTYVLVTTAITKSETTYYHYYQQNLGTSDDLYAFLCADYAELTLKGVTTTDNGLTEEAYDFYANRPASNVGCTTTDYIKVNKTSSNIIANTQIEMNDRFAAQFGSGSWMMHKDNALYSANNGSRKFAVLNLKANDRVIITFPDGYAPTFSGTPNAYIGVNGDVSDGTTLVSGMCYTIKADGMMALQAPNYGRINTVTIWTSAPVLTKPTITFNSMVENGDLYYPQVTISGEDGVTFKNGANETITSPYTFTDTGTLTVYAAKTGRTNSAKTTYTVSNGWILAKSVNASSLDGTINYAGGSVTYGNDAAGTWAVPGVNFESTKWNYYTSNLQPASGDRTLSCSVLNTNRIAVIKHQLYSNSNIVYDYLTSTSNSVSYARYDQFQQYNLYVSPNEEVSVTIGSTGYSTFSSPVPLDFSGVDGLTAYVAKNVGGGYVTLTSVTTAPANTGLVLKGTAEATYNIPVTASAEAPESNMLVGCIVNTTVAKDETSGFNNYVLVIEGDESKFQSLVVNGASMPAGKAFLKNGAYVANPVRSLKIAFEDAETGINEVNAPEAAANGYFNLAGQRVANPTKGLYIVNGKKVLVK